MKFEANYAVLDSNDLCIGTITKCSDLDRYVFDVDGDYFTLTIAKLVEISTLIDKLNNGEPA